MEPDQPETILFPGQKSWEHAALLPDGSLARSESGSSSATARCFLPARDFVSAPLLMGEVDGDAAPATVALHLETGGLPSGEGQVAHWLLPSSTAGATAVFSHLNHEVEDEKAQHFDHSARLYAHACPDGIALWEELGQLVVGFYSGGACAHAQVLGAREANADAATEIATIALSLAGDDIIPRPEKIVLLGLGTTGDFEAQLAQLLAIGQQKSREPRRAVPTDTLPLVPPQIFARRASEKTQRRWLQRAGLAAALYLLAALATFALIKSGERKVAELEGIRDGMREEVFEGRLALARWGELAPAIDPALYPPALLAKLVAQLPQDGVRLSSFQLEGTGALFSGEAENQGVALALQRQLLDRDPSWGFTIRNALPDEPTPFFVEFETGQPVD